MPASPAGWHAAEGSFRCEQFDLFIRRGLRRLLPEDKHAMHVGILVHAARENFFKGGLSWVGFKEFERIAVEEKATFQRDEMEDAAKLMDAYAEHWSKLPRPRVVSTERTYEGRLFKAAGKLGLFGLRTARLDDISTYVESGGRLAIGELKTTSGSARQVIEEYTLHGQTLMQAAVYAASGAPHGPVSGHVFDIVEKKYSKSGSGITGAKCSRHFVSIPPHALGWFAENLRLMYSRQSADLKAPALRNLTACARPHRNEFGVHHYACQFREVCRYGPSAAGEYIYTDPKTGETTGAQRAPRWVMQ